jgi:hypothetical protein
MPSPATVVTMIFPVSAGRFIAFFLQPAPADMIIKRRKKDILFILKFFGEVL